MNNRVLIVGRPNVGKSTLFNRITGRKKSIVYPVPGITRDLIEAKASWKGKSFIVVDTGGIFEKAGDIEGKVAQKVKEALREASVILFVVDGKEGLTASDEYVARLLYPYKDKVFLVVNKVDTKAVKKNVYEFYSLGFEQVFFVSAQHGTGVGELLDATWERLSDEEVSLDYEGIKVSFVGRPNVGKSSLVNALLGSERVIVSPIAGTTRDAIEIPFNYKGENLVLIDTAGIRRRSKVDYGVEFFSVGRAIKAIEMSHVVCLVIDLGEGVTHQDKTIGGLIERRYRGCVIVGNKMDLVKKPKEVVEEALRRELHFLDFAPIVLTSAIKGEGVDKILDSVLLVYKDYTKTHKTSFINRAIEKILSERGLPGDIKVYYAFQESTAPPTVVVFTNDPEKWKESYKRFFVKRLREYLNVKHSPIKLVLRGREEG